MRVKDVWRIESLNIEFETIYIYAENSTHAIFTSGDRISNFWLRILLSIIPCPCSKIVSALLCAIVANTNAVVIEG